MNVEPVDLGDEIRHGVDLCLALAPIVRVHPILRELLHGCELDALRCIRDQFALRPLGRLDAIAQIDEVGFKGLEMKRTNSGVVSHSLILCLPRMHQNNVASTMNADLRGDPSTCPCAVALLTP